MEKRIQKLRLTFLITVFTIFTIVLLFNDVIAVEQSQLDRSYNFLKNRCVGKWASIGLDAHIFCLEALEEKLTSRQVNASVFNLNAKSYNSTCWPGPSEGVCNVLETARAKMVLYETGYADNMDSIDEWIINHTSAYNGVDWRLQISSSTNAVNCLIRYDSMEGESEGEFMINSQGIIESMTDNMKSCFYNITLTPYWLGLKNISSCLNQTFELSCDEDVNANFFFMKGSKYYITSDLIIPYKIGDPFNMTLSSRCAGKDGQCNYESTLWAAYSFYRTNQQEKAKSFIPYLVMLEEENQALMPSAFLYAITQQENYAEDISALQDSTGLIIVPGSTHCKYYNNGLSRITGAAKEPGTNTTKMENRLFSNLEQKTEGSYRYWSCTSEPNDQIEDTSLILLGTSSSSQQPPTDPCLSAGLGFSCVANCTTAGGSRIMFCNDGSECCNLTTSNYECTSRSGSCKPTCYSNETQTSYNCEAGTICCKQIGISLCVSEIHGQICSSSSDCINNLTGAIIPFITSADSAYCCKGNCSSGNGQRQSCASLYGTICNPSTSSCQDNWLSAIEPNCCRLGFCVAGQLTCAQQGGTRCASGEGCKDGTLVIASDTNNQATCCIQGGRCISQSCTGASCEEGEACYGGTMKETLDVIRCCEGGNCLKTCNGYGGNPCGSDLVCKGTKKPSSDFANCCVGTCEKKTFPWLIVIIIAAVVLGILAFFLLRKKGGKEKKESDSELMYGFPPASSPSPSAIPASYSQPSLPKQRAPASPSVPMAPRAMSRSQPSQSSAKKRPTKAKTSRENDLDDTLEKLKKMSGQ
ncbi:MAG: hypothetical protein NTX24_04695 [Candidatus Pacearchaeota archaeon]|nr:hypothetical protein [Candidatus Pacearchaeota archaeon]